MIILPLNPSCRSVSAHVTAAKPATPVVMIITKIGIIVVNVLKCFFLEFTVHHYLENRKFKGYTEIFKKILIPHTWWIGNCHSKR